MFLQRARTITHLQKISSTAIHFLTLFGPLRKFFNFLTLLEVLRKKKLLIHMNPRGKYSFEKMTLPLFMSYRSRFERVYARNFSSCVGSYSCGAGYYIRCVGSCMPFVGWNNLINSGLLVTKILLTDQISV